MTLRYTLDGKPSGLVSYAGDVALFTVLKRILFTPGLGVEVTVLDPVSVDGKTRQALCLGASAAGVALSTAEREEARRRRLQAMSETKAEAERPSETDLFVFEGVCPAGTPPDRSACRGSARR